MSHLQISEKDYGRTDSYRVAVTPFVPDDGRTTDGRPKSRRRRLPTKSSKSLSTINEELETLKDQLDMDEHRIPLDELYSRYATDPNMGLSLARVREVQDVYGLNKLSPPLKTPEWVRLAKNLLGGFSVVLWIGCCLSLITYSVQSEIMEQPPFENLTLGIILGFVVIITGIFSFYHELKGDQVIASLKHLRQEYCTVIREGRRQIIPIEDIVMGDLLELKAGDRIPADVRIIASHNFRVDQSSITGNLEPQSKSSEHTHDNPLECMNLAFCSTYATEGTCRGVVIRTGDLTAVGSVFQFTINLQETDVLLTDEITWWMHLLTSTAVTVAVVLFVIAFIVGFHWLDSVVFVIGISLAIIPEGLVAVVTICLTLTVKRLYKKNCLITQMSALERIGAVSAILVDKSSSLTYQKPTVSHLFINGNIISAGESPQHINSQGFRTMARIAILCNQVEATNQADDYRTTNSNITDLALLQFMDAHVDNIPNLRSRNRKVCEIPFSSNTRFQLTIHETNDDHDSSYLLTMKGAPEEIIQRCSTAIYKGKEVTIDEKYKEVFARSMIELGRLGENVIGFCDYKLPFQKYPTGYPFDPDEINFPLTGLRFVGLISLSDPPRATAPHAINKCRSAGIRVVMVTGDHPISATAVARSLDLFSEDSITVDDVVGRESYVTQGIVQKEGKAILVHGAELKTMSPEQLHHILSNYKEIVFARTSLQQKMYIVEGLQHAGSVVAATGVGVSDIPAIKKADIGIAMGLSNTDVVKLSSGLVLLDNNFSTIVTAIEEGRLIYENLRKSVSYIMASNVPEFVPFVVFLILGVPLPLGAIVILVIDMGTDMIPAISLSYEQPEYDLMNRDPRNDISDRLIDIKLLDVMCGQIGMIQAAAGFFTYFVCMGENGFWLQHLLFVRRKWNALGVNDLRDSYGQEWTLEQRKHLEWTAHSAFFISIVMCQWITLIICKTRTRSIFQQGFWNSYLTFALIIETVLAIFLVICPGMDKALRLYPVRINWWITGLPYCLLIFIYDECRRFLLRRFSKK